MHASEDVRASVAEVWRKQREAVDIKQRRGRQEKDINRKNKRQINTQAT
jgi:hypothetical protein